jgi:thiol-disulfide isomerase/thioredoxin
MPIMITRLSILLLACLVTGGIVWVGRRFVEAQRQQALAAFSLAASSDNSIVGTSGSSFGVRILAFSSEDCHQCHTMQAPALQRVQDRYGESVTIIDVDAPNEPELTHRYHVLTVPTTVVLDAAGRPHAVNYGFTPTQKLIAQVQEAVTQAAIA